jgi:hypothetical protein
MYVIVPQLSGKYLMVSHESIDSAPGSLCVFADLLDEVEHLSVLVASADNVSELDYGEFSADPFARFINSTGQLKRFARRSQIRMDVSNHDDPLRLTARCLRIVLGLRATAREQDQRHYVANAGEDVGVVESSG